MFVVGLLLSSNPDATGDLVQVPSMLFQGSLLLGLISRATLGYAYVPVFFFNLHYAKIIVCLLFKRDLNESLLSLISSFGDVVI